MNNLKAILEKFNDSFSSVSMNSFQSPTVDYVAKINMRLNHTSCPTHRRPADTCFLLRGTDGVAT